MSFGAQDEVVKFLATLDGGAHDIVTTHISIVTLCATRAYKLKRAVTYPYLDFSTPEKRLAMCEREVALNRRLAAGLYLGARRVTRESDGALALDGAGALVDAIVEMRRFDEELLFERLAAAGRLTPPMIDALAATLARFHDAADIDVMRGGRAGMEQVVALNEESARRALPAQASEREALLTRLRDALEANGALLDARRAAGKVRRGHGDLTLRNICLYDGAPTPFDCLEFSDELATIDILYDIAFLLMDLWRVGALSLANRALNRYLDDRDETDGLPLLPFFMTLRAIIRAHVAATQGKSDEARAYVDLAAALLRRPSGQIVAIGGLSGSGKSSVAAALAPRLGAAPGARTLNSDRIRKKMFSAPPTARLPPEAYASEVSARVYADMFDAARRTAGAGWPVIVDAVMDRPQDRATIEKIADTLGVRFAGFWLDADFERRARRIDARLDDVSDATREVLRAQMQSEQGEMTWARIDASGGVETIVSEIENRLRS